LNDPVRHEILAETDGIAILKKLVHLLAVSAGGGLLVGVGIRLANNRRPNVSRSHSWDESADRIAPFLLRLESLEKKIASFGASAAEVSPWNDGLVSNSPKTEIARQEIEIAAQVDAMEKRLRQDLDRRQDEGLHQVSVALEKRLAERIAPIEAQIENQRAAVGELRDFSLRTEKSLQKLLEGIEKLVASQNLSSIRENISS
jgi:hypothetical protein